MRPRRTRLPPGGSRKQAACEAKVKNERLEANTISPQEYHARRQARVAKVKEERFEAGTISPQDKRQQQQQQRP